MIFKSYSSIDNVNRVKTIKRIHEQGHAGGEWIATEKIHGANFSFWVTEVDIACAKRTGFLQEHSNFFNFQDVCDELERRLHAMFSYIKENKYPDTECVTVYGELYGGAYPHKNIDREYMSKTVQKGVYYTPKNSFIAFDMVVHDGFEEDSKHRVMEHDFVYEICEMHGITHVPVIYRGSFEECINLENEFQTQVPEMFGLPEIEGNIAEGLVIKPAVPKFFWSGGRVMLKSKNEKWSEKSKKKKTKKKKTKDLNKENNVEFEPSEKVKSMIEEVLTYVTENRLRNVLSKMEQVTDRHFGMVVGNMNKDIIEEFKADYPDELESLETKERKLITKRMGNEVSVLVRKNFVNIIDGEF